MLDTIANLGICILGPIAVWFLMHKQKWMRWGYIIGLCSEPFWLLTALIHKQWGIVILAFIYSYCYTKGIWNYWIKNRRVINEF